MVNLGDHSCCGSDNAPVTPAGAVNDHSRNLDRFPVSLRYERFGFQDEILLGDFIEDDFLGNLGLLDSHLWVFKLVFRKLVGYPLVSGPISSRYYSRQNDQPKQITRKTQKLSHTRIIRIQNWEAKQQKVGL